MLPSANIVPLSDDGWLTVLWVTVGLCVVWIAVVAAVSRYRYVTGPGQGVQRKPPSEPGTARILGARTVLVGAVGIAAVALVVFLVGRAGDLLA